MKLMSAYVYVFFAMPVLVFLVGCERARLAPPTAPSVESYVTKGELQFDGKPVAGARLMFRPLPARPDARTWSAITHDDGSFYCSTNFPGDGLPPGKYIVTATWPESICKDVDMEIDRLNGKLANPNRPIGHVEIKTQDNLLPPFKVQ